MKLVLFNKPWGVLCQFTGTAEERTLADFVPVTGVYAAGRLDKDSEGLLLLTDDGRLQHRISHPRAKMAKTYWVQVEGQADNSLVHRLAAGVTLNDGPTLPAQVRLLPTEPPLWPRDPPIRFRKNLPTSWLEVQLHEGRNRQLRRMTAACGFPTLRLVRVQIGEWRLDNLQPGQFRVIELASAPATAQRQHPRVRPRGNRKAGKVPPR